MPRGFDFDVRQGEVGAFVATVRRDARFRSLQGKGGTWQSALDDLLTQIERVVGDPKFNEAAAAASEEK